jgi:hypothetical protein
VDGHGREGTKACYCQGTYTSCKRVLPHNMWQQQYMDAIFLQDFYYYPTREETIYKPSQVTTKGKWRVQGLLPQQIKLPFKMLLHLALPLFLTKFLSIWQGQSP